MIIEEKFKEEIALLQYSSDYQDVCNLVKLIYLIAERDGFREGFETAKKTIEETA